MTKEDLTSYDNDWQNEQLSSGAYILFLKLHISELEERTCEGCKYSGKLHNFEGKHTSYECELEILEDVFNLPLDFGCNKWEAK